MKIIKTFTALCYLFFITSAAFFVFKCVSFPSVVRFTENTSHYFNFGGLVDMVIQSDAAIETNTVLPNNSEAEPESVNVLSVNTEKVANNINTSQSGISINAENEGTAYMTINALGVPLKKVKLDVLPEIEVIPCGMTVGVRINTDGIMVLGTGNVNGEDGQSHNPSDGKLAAGDLILSANGAELKSKNQLTEIIESSNGDLILKIKRGNVTLTEELKPVISNDDKKYKIGIWVREGTQGIGTVTYYNPSTKRFAALGHGILDIDTKKLMSIKSGILMKSEIISIKKGGKGSPGELLGEIKGGKSIGMIDDNSQSGIYGTANDSFASEIKQKPIKIGLRNEVHEGPATILSNVKGTEVKQYDIYIESLNKNSSDNAKGMVIRITDPELLRLTNGIVQGMSGSPIIQDGKLIGAVTHVFVQDPTKGYGIFIENMIAHERGL